MKTNSNYQNKVNDLVSQLHEGCFLVSNNEKEIIYSNEDYHILYSAEITKII
ncbi:hypothetical protein OXPF_29710 [Oxobacter pfennigii]|uniref:Uncharacterized protein n=1 Tax=Oxobacter pfennigii TaxID=36849 RepID=A0A0P8YUZ9_9CLOT|nr:hypothetical protein OXPF_29710 [Oxobacter pfennigii]